MIPFEKIVEENEYRERIIKFFRIPIKISASQEKFVSDLEYMKSISPDKYEEMVKFTEADFNAIAVEQGTESPDFSMEDVLNPLVTLIGESEEWKSFLKEDYSDILDDFEGAINTHQFYKNENNGKSFVSIDLVAANWQSLQRIMGFDESYEELIKQYTTRLIPLHSKTIRTKIAGMLASKKITDYNKKILFEAKEGLIKELYESTGVNLVNIPTTAFYADEFITELDDKSLEILNSMDLSKVEENLYKATGLKVHVRPFTLKALNLGKGYVKFTKNDFEILCLNKDILLIANKIMNGYELKEIDFESVKLKEETREEFVERLKESLTNLDLL